MMEAAPAKHPSSIMSLHSTQGGGRKKSIEKRMNNSGAANDPSRFSGEIIGDVILKGKRELWGGSQIHYHHGMQAGDNTLNACCARLMIRHLVTNKGYNKIRWLEDYIAFMTASPAQHPDTYAESYHRVFFANLRNGIPADKCGAATHDTPSMGALVTVGPLALALLSKYSVEQVQQICSEHVRLTHPDEGLLRVVAQYVSLLHTLLTSPEQVSGFNVEATEKDNKADLFVQAAKVVPGATLNKFLHKPISDMLVVGGEYSTACYISESWPSVCYLAAKYSATPGKALLINTNLGGENAHRGAVLGTLVSMVNGQYDEALFQQLLHREAIAQEVDQLIKLFG